MFENNQVEIQKLKDRIKLLEEHLKNTEKLDSLGLSALTVAHEIDNPINFITSAFYALKQSLDDFNQVEKLYEDIHKASSFDEVSNQLQKINETKKEIQYDLVKEEINEAANSIKNGFQQIEKISSDLRTLYLKKKYTTLKFDINKSLERTISIVKYSIKEKIKIVKDFGEIPMINSQGELLNQVFTNIIKNAIEAIEEKHPSNNTENSIILSTKLNNNIILIKIIDTGCGMTKEVKENVFSMFYTTKEKSESKGSGIGMAHTKRAIEIHNGKISVESEQKKGTTFTIHLPVA